MIDVLKWLCSGHLSAQYVDGLRGPLIVYGLSSPPNLVQSRIVTNRGYTDPDDPLKKWYDVDDESTIIQLGDWYHRPSSELLKEWFSVRPEKPARPL